MKKLLLLSLLLMSFNILAAECIDKNGAVYSNCEITTGPSGEEPNIFIRWLPPTERVDNTLLSIDEIAAFKIYFHDVVVDNWTEVTINNSVRAVSIYKPPSKYEIIATTIDTGKRESSPSIKLIADLPNLLLQSPKGISSIIIEISIN